MRNILVLGFVSVGFLAGCSDVTGSVAAIGDNGVIMKGTATAKANGDGQILLSGPYGECTGNYNSYDMSLTIPISLLCEDGTTVIGSATRTASGRSGSGTMRDSNGRDWRYVFGENATALF